VSSHPNGPGSARRHPSINTSPISDVYPVREIRYRADGLLRRSLRFAHLTFRFRHVILPKPMLRLLPDDLFEDGKARSVLRILSEEEWR
jgi:hypothetical protein